MNDNPKIVAVGAALSANKGAASMLQALVDNIDAVAVGSRVISLSTHPNADRLVARSDRLDIVSFKPMAMLLIHFPLALLIGLSRSLGFRGRAFARTLALKALLDSDVVADLAGISFSDGRGLPTLAYNTLMTSVPLLIGVPVVKCSQAIGPMRTPSTRGAARIVLPRLRSIVARGDGTRQHLIDFGLSNVVEGADLAFVMDVSADNEASAKELLGALGAQDYFVVSPSSVVEALCESEGIDYVKLLADVVDRLTATTGLSAVLIAHSALPGRGRGRMNDLPVTRDIAERCSVGTALLSLDQDLDPRILRAIIGGARFLVASRFHAMIAGLATAVPTVVVGWSHKYREVMNEFGLERFVLAFSDFSAERVLDLAIEATTQRDSLVGQIKKELPRMQESSRMSLRVLREAVVDA